MGDEGVLARELATSTYSAEVGDSGVNEGSKFREIWDFEAKDWPVVGVDDEVFLVKNVRSGILVVG